MHGIPTKMAKANPIHKDEGWWATIAKWPGKDKTGVDGPKISIFFDHTLDVNDGCFWFGFESTTRDAIDNLASDLGSAFRPWALFDDENLNDETAFEDEVRRCRGLAHERCDGEYYFGKYEAGFDARSDRELASRAAQFIVQVITACDPSFEDFVERQDIREIEQAKGLLATEREALVKARRGQGKFRSDLIEFWKGCALSGCAVTEVLRASHIQPWKLSDNAERLDSHNGLLLAATFDALFDRGLISFDRNGVILISETLTSEERERLSLRDDLCLLKTPSQKQSKYLAGHRRAYGFS